uniref:Uncharacterized protein n=1 Tax=Hyaloperonospora arabidopsidis (strain Emoy2) TaxID=559515 RepID=M4BZ93_HYAAE
MRFSTTSLRQLQEDSLCPKMLPQERLKKRYLRNYLSAGRIVTNLSSRFSR